MSNSPNPPNNTTKSSANSLQNASKYGYLGAAILLVIVMLLGFQQFYLHGRAFPDRPLAPPIRNLIIIHGIAMSIWMLLLVVQSALARTRKIKLHMTLGKIGAVLAVIIFLSGIELAIESARIAPPEVILWGLNMKQFMAVPIVTILLFGAFITIGIVKRKRPLVHRPMMLLASLAAVSAAADRVPAIKSIYSTNVIGELIGPLAFAVGFGILFIVLQFLLTRKLDKHFAIGLAITFVVGTLFFQIADTPAWEMISNLLLGI